MSYKDICKIAYDYYIKYAKLVGLCSAYDIGDCIVFGAGDPNVINYGGGLLAVNKYDGTTSGFGVAENIDLLMDAKELDIPEKYKFKES